MTKYWHTRPIIVALAIERESRRFASSQSALYLPLIHLFSLLTSLPTLITLSAHSFRLINSLSLSRLFLFLYATLFSSFLSYSPFFLLTEVVQNLWYYCKMKNHNSFRYYCAITVIAPSTCSFFSIAFLSLSLSFIHPLYRRLILTAKDILLSFFSPRNLKQSCCAFFQSLRSRQGLHLQPRPS